jgi:fengycin family lipopeptide synthetase B
LQRWDGREKTLITLEGHGRDGLQGLDVGLTVGWFTTLFPFGLTLPSNDVQADMQAMGEQIKWVKECLRQIPQNGFDYGVLRYISGQDILSQAEKPFLSFNYLGQFDEAQDGFFSFADESSGMAISPRIQRQHELDLVGLIARGQLTISLTFSPNLLDQAAANRLLALYKEAILAIVTHCQQRVDGEKTVSDFTADISNDDLNAIMGLFD